MKTVATCSNEFLRRKNKNEQLFSYNVNYYLYLKEETLKLIILSISLDKERDRTDELKQCKSRLVKVSTLKSRLESLEKKKLCDPATVILNACDIICTTLGSISKLQK